MIAEATLRDVSYIGANMRQRDADEILCQLPDDITAQQAAVWCWESACLSWVAFQHGQPAFAFGVTPSSNPGLYSAWGFGTKHARRTFPEVTKFIVKEARREFIMGFNPRRLEIRSSVDHDYANRWLPALGAHLETRLLKFGTRGEAFFQWSIVKP